MKHADATLGEAMRLARIYAGAKHSETFVGHNDAIALAKALLAVSETAMPKLSEIVNDAEVIGNVMSAMLDLDASYDGGRVTFTFLSTSDAMGHIQKARSIVEQRLGKIRAARDALEATPSATRLNESEATQGCPSTPLAASDNQFASALASPHDIHGEKI